MGFKLNYQTPFGITAKEAYFKISNFNGRKNFITIFLEVYFNKEARDSDSQCIETKVLNLPIDCGGTFIDMYDAIKALDEFQGAEDV